MKAILTAAVLSFIALSGCKSNCEEVGSKFIGLEGMNHWGGIPPQAVGQWLPRLSAAVATACTEDKWPADARSCVMDANDRNELSACDFKLGPDLMKKLSDRLQPLVAEMRK